MRQCVHLMREIFAQPALDQYRFDIKKEIIFWRMWKSNTGTARSKHCLWPITDTECQVWAQTLRSTFWELIL